MRTATLLPVLFFLASSSVSAEHGSDALRRRHHSQAERMMDNIKRQETSTTAILAGKRIVTKRGQTCRVRPGSQAALAAEASASSASASSVSITSTSSTMVVESTSTSSTAAETSKAVEGNNYVAPAQHATTTTAEWHAPSPAAATSAAAAPTQEHKPAHNSGGGGLTPNGRKCGISAGDSLKEFENQIGWYYNWAPSDPWQSSSKVAFVPTLWGGGSADSVDSARLVEFKQMSHTPTWLIGPNEPDCEAGGQMSAGMSIDATATLWNELMAPKGNAGAMLLSPSMCKQMAEDGWLGKFQGKISRDWDITNVHINKNNIQGVKDTIDYYYNTYKKPLWVTEFACVNDNPNFIPCTDQGQINQFIHDIVDVLENDSRVYAYAYSNGNGLGNVWPLWSNGGLSESGKAYKSALSKYY